MAVKEAKQASPWPLRQVVRVGVSPMNPKVKWAELSCGHDAYLYRKPRIGAQVPCDKCPRNDEK